MKNAYLLAALLLLFFPACRHAKKNTAKPRSDWSGSYHAADHPKGRYSFINKVSIEDIGIRDIPAKIPSTGKTLVVMWAPWSLHSLADLRYLNGGHKADYDSVVVLCTSYDLDQIRTFTKGNTENWLFYLVDDIDAYHVENDKIKHIVKLLCSSCESFRGVPKQFYYVNGQMQWENDGELSLRGH